MSALITVHNGDHITGQCDAKCYDATGPDCNCICGGKNHGAGKAQATQNTIEMANEWIEAYKQERGGLVEGEKVVINQQIYQTKLFD